MAFAINMHPAPRIFTYDGAARLFTKAEAGSPIKKDAYRLPGKPRAQHMSVRMATNGDVAFRYHYTDVITWHPDGSYTLCPFSSRSTCSFFDHFAPSGHYLTRDGGVLILGDTGYALSGGAVHVKDNVPTGGLRDFNRTRVDRKAAKRVLAETRYGEYRDWHAIMKPLLGANRQPWFDTLTALEDETNWPMMAACWSNRGHPNAVRAQVYAMRSRDVYYDETYPKLPAALAQRSAYRPW